MLAQRCNDRAVVDLGLAYHRLGELDLRGDVGQRYGVVVVVGYVQSALEGRTGGGAAGLVFTKTLQWRKVERVEADTFKIRQCFTITLC